MMDFKGASWVGDIYHKIEAMYLEVEETICEDAVKFVESQVQNVGSNMKKFYTDVMQDLASSDSTDPVKLPVTDLPLNSNADTIIDENKKSSCKEDTKKVGDLFTNSLKEIDREDGDQESSLAEHFKQMVNPCSGDSTKEYFSMQDTKEERHEDTTVYYKNQVSENQDQASFVSEKIHEYAATEHMALASPQASVEVVGWEWDSREDEKEMSSCEGIDVDDFAVDGPIFNDVLSLRTIGKGLGQDSIETDSLVKSNALGDSKTCQSAGELVPLSDSGSFSNCDEDVIETNDSTELKVETSNEDTIKLEETCVFVNENNISFASHKDGKPWSYKKKMREAFSLRKKSSRRQEYKKLITQYEGVDASSSLTCTVTHAIYPESNTADLQTREVCESDWELL